MSIEHEYDVSVTVSVYSSSVSVAEYNATPTVAEYSASLDKVYLQYLTYIINRADNILVNRTGNALIKKL